MPKRTDIKSILIIGAGPIVIGWCDGGKSKARSASQFRPASTPVMAAQAAIHGLAEGETKNKRSRNEKVVDGGLRRHDGVGVGRKREALSSIASRRVFSRTKKYRSVFQKLPHLEVVRNRKEIKMTNSELPSSHIVARELLRHLYLKQKPIRPSDIYRPLAETLKLTNHQLSLKRATTDGSLWENHVQAAREHLAKNGFVERARRGYWSLTQAGIVEALKLEKMEMKFREIDEKLGLTDLA